MSTAAIVPPTMLKSDQDEIESESEFWHDWDELELKSDQDEIERSKSVTVEITYYS